MSITRTDTNGTNPVRLKASAAPIAGSLVVTDYEAALSGLIRYDVVDSTSAVTSASTTLTNAATPAVQIRSVQLPQISATPALVTAYTAARPTASTVHQPIDRPDAIVIVGRARLRAGRMTILALDYASALALDGVLSSGHVLMLRQTAQPGMDMPFSVTGPTTVETAERTAAGWRWTVSVDYTEVRVPALPLLGAAGWTYADVLAQRATYSAVRAAYATYAALAAGTPS